MRTPTIRTFFYINTFVEMVAKPANETDFPTAFPTNPF